MSEEPYAITGLSQLELPPQPRRTRFDLWTLSQIEHGAMLTPDFLSQLTLQEFHQAYGAFARLLAHARHLPARPESQPNRLIEQAATRL